MDKIEGLEFDAEAVPLDEIGRADGQELDAIIGVLTMEKWEIKIDPKKQKLDLEGLRRREFTEFFERIICGQHRVAKEWRLTAFEYNEAYFKMFKENNGIYFTI